MSDADESVRAKVLVSFFENDDCSGESDGYFETPPSTVVGEWVVVQAGALTETTTRSVSVELLGLKPATASEMTIYFDNVMLKANELVSAVTANVAEPLQSTRSELVLEPISVIE